MDKWQKIEHIDFIFCRLYAIWENIEIDFETEPPDSLDRLSAAVERMCDALAEFKEDVEKRRFK